MADPFFYPDLDAKTVKNLEIVRQLMAEHASYWLTSPYSGEIEQLCTGWFGGKQKRPSRQEEADDAAPEEQGWEFLYKETLQLYRDLKNQKAKALDTDDAAAYFRVATALLEKLLTMQERAQGLKQVSDFHGAVLDIMEGVLSPTQRTEVMERLELAITGGR